MWLMFTVAGNDSSHHHLLGVRVMFDQDVARL